LAVGRSKVLIADDEEGIRVLCRVNLELTDLDVIEAADGAEALAKARSERPDVILLDVRMPVMVGWEVLLQLTADPETASIPVIMLTARTSEADQIRAWGEGVIDYLSKPFSPQLLEDTTVAALQPRDAASDDERRRRIIEQLRSMQDLRRLR
jgi:DNA-binding response OmpR family regulator